MCLFYYATLGRKPRFWGCEFGMVLCVCVFVMLSWRFFPRFSSRAPGKCLITSGFVLSAMIILFYAVLFSYSGLGMKALIFHWSTHWGTFCVYI